MFKSDLMPFKSKSQWRLCYTLQKQGKGWDCEEWRRGVKYSSLPEKNSKRSRSRSRTTRSRTTRKGRSTSRTTRSRSAGKRSRSRSTRSRKNCT